MTWGCALRCWKTSSTLIVYVLPENILRVLLRIVGWILIVVIAVVGGAAWWLFVRPLPQVDGTASLAGLQHEVTIERDVWGIPHIRAEALADMAEAQGYV